MAVNAASSTYVNNASSNKGFSGLASGVDTESMVEQLLSGTQTKIDKQNALKQQLEWKQEIYRDLISQINSFQTKFFSYSSDSNLMSESFFNAMSAVTSSSAFKATATTSAATGSSTLEVRRLATKTSLTGTSVSGGLMGELDKTKLQDLIKKQLGTAEDYTVKFQVGDKDVTVDLRDVFVNGSGFKTYSSTTDLDKALQTKLEDAFKDTGVKVSVKDGAMSLVTEGKDRPTITVSTDSGSLGLSRLGLTTSSRAVSKSSTETTTLSGTVDGTPKLEFTVTLDDLKKTVSIDLTDVTDKDGNLGMATLRNAIQDAVDAAHGKGQVDVIWTGNNFELSVTQGRKVAVGGDAATLEAMGLKNGQANRIGLGETLGDLKLQNPLWGSSFRFTINDVEFHFTEATTVAEVLEAVNGSKAGVRMVYRAQSDSFVLESTESGAGKQINLAQEEGNFLNALFGVSTATGKRAYSRKLTYEEEVPGEDGETVKVTKEYTGEDTLEKAGLSFVGIDKSTKLEDLEAASGGRFIFEDGRIVLTKSYTAPGPNTKATMVDLFGADSITLKTETENTANLVMGQNALIVVDGDVTERSSNNFSINGINYDVSDITGEYSDVIMTLNGVEVDFSDGKYFENGKLYDKDGTEITGTYAFTGEDGQPAAVKDLVFVGGKLQKFTGSPAKVTVSQNTDQIMDGIKSFMDEYNKLIKTINDYLDEDTNYRDYAPLTTAQKAEMSEREIELWEQKSKEGLLHRDNTLQTFLQQMRTVLYQKPANGGYALYELGIETGAWETKGQLTFTTDGEARLRQLLESDPTNVMKLFTDPEDGLGVKLNTVLNETAKISSGSPGTLVRLAGVKGTGTEKDNSIYDQLKALDDKIAALKRTYEAEKTRYWNQFNTMEQLISNMNTQSAYLSQMMGY